MRLSGRGVRCVRGGREVFSGLDFDASAGEALAVIGSNGSGKTSLLRLIAGLLTVAGGSIGLEGGDFATIIRSIEDRMFSKLAADTIVMPGHGDDTTIGTERPHLQEWIDRGW